MLSFFWCRRTLTCIGILFLVALAVMGSPQARAAALPLALIRLPVEVMGQNGTTQTVIVNVPTSQRIVSLAMRLHGLTYINKASVRVNLGPWVSLNNTTANVAEPGKSFGGIGGAFATVSVSVPMPTGLVHLGANTISFRFNATDGVSIGFRVLDFNFITASGQMALPTATFTQDDPNIWTAPRPDAASIAAGRNLWHSAVLVTSSQDSTPILATCADCHSEDGRDLKYFSYSNYSIIARSKFHGLNQAQGEQIASYIRSLPVTAYGRPWNPPYQPGPGLDSKPVAAWAAGAGIDAVLTQDSQMLPYLFPNGITKDAADTRGTLNLRELPISLPLPDWNHWLPKIHPKDAWGSDFVNSAFAKMYDGQGTANEANGNIRGRLLTNTPAGYHQWFMTDYTRGVRPFLAYWRSKQFDFLRPRQDNRNTAWTPEYAEKIFSTAQWHLVKEWELMQEFQMEGNGPAIYGPGGESRTWLDGTVFQVSPAALSIPNDNTTLFTKAQYEYQTNAWYYAEAVINSGNRHREGWAPIDWGYARGRISDLSRVTHVSEYLRMTAMMIKAMQQSDISGKVDTGSGWFPVWSADLKQFLFHSPYGNGYILNEALSSDPTQDAALHAQIQQAMTAAWFDKMQQYTAQDYYTAGMAAPNDQMDNRNSLYNSVYAMLTPRGWGYTSMYQEGVNKQLLNSVADWAKTLWPNTNWDAFKQ